MNTKPNEEELKPIQLNVDQENAVETMLEFLTTSREPYLVLTGSAGTGKTTCVQTAVKRYKGNIALTAPTNKATKVLRDMALKWGCDNVQVRTIFSMLGLVLKGDQENQYISAEGQSSAGTVNAIVVDEGSMISEELFSHIAESVLEYGVKFIFMGDPFQLPPVNEIESPVMILPSKIHLEKVERHDNQVLVAATEIRNAAREGRKAILQSNNDESGGVWTCDGKKFDRHIEKAFTSDTYADDTSSVRVIAWRNNAVNGYNKYIRQLLYPDSASQPYHIGERVVICKPLYDMRVYAAAMSGNSGPPPIEVYTDDEGVIVDITEEVHPIIKDIRCNVLTLDIDGREKFFDVFTCHPAYQETLDNKLAQAANLAKTRKGAWQSFWDLKGMFADARPCHAITAHRSQGSTYEIALVDVADISANYNFGEMMKCLYVACTRASRILIVRTR